MGIPWECWYVGADPEPEGARVSQQITATSAQHNYTQINVPRRGFLWKIIVHQVDGVAAGFTVDLYNRKEILNLSGDPDQAGASRAISRIMPTLTAGSGNSEVSDYTQRSYVNGDSGSTNAERLLYLDIQPVGTGPKNFAVAIAIEEPTAL
jgi:hypothetical protein